MPRNQAGPHFPVDKRGLDLPDESVLPPADSDGSGRYSGSKFKNAAYRAAYKEQEKKLGANLDPKTKLFSRLAYSPTGQRSFAGLQTNRLTNRCLAAARSMVLVKDPDFHTVEEQFHEAVFTHASTS